MGLRKLIQKRALSDDMSTQFTICVERISRGTESPATPTTLLFTNCKYVAWYTHVSRDINFHKFSGRLVIKLNFAIEYTVHVNLIPVAYGRLVHQLKDISIYVK